MRLAMSRNPINLRLFPILFRKEDHENDTESTISAKEYSIHGNIPGTVDDNFPEISRDSECI